MYNAHVYFPSNPLQQCNTTALLALCVYKLRNYDIFVTTESRNFLQRMFEPTASLTLDKSISDKINVISCNHRILFKLSAQLLNIEYRSGLHISCGWNCDIVVITKSRKFLQTSLKPFSLLNVKKVYLADEIMHVGTEAIMPAVPCFSVEHHTVHGRTCVGFALCPAWVCDWFQVMNACPHPLASTHHIVSTRPPALRIIVFC